MVVYVLFYVCFSVVYLMFVVRVCVLGLFYV